MKSPYIKLVLVIVLTFLLGATSGSLGTLHAVRSVARQLAHADTLNARLFAQLDSHLGLSAEQHQQAAQVLQELQPEYETVQAKSRQDRQALLDDFQAKMNSFLTDDQKQKLTQLRQERTERIHKFFGIPKPERAAWR